MENPKYTGYAFFGRWARQEMLLDPDDVAAGNVVRFRRASAELVVRSRRPAHPEIVSVEDFTRAQLKRKAKAANGLKSARTTERAGRKTKRTYLFRGLLRCEICGRKMEASPRAHGMYYRCPARTLAPGSHALADHPPTVYVREDPLREAVNGWVGQLFGPEHVDRTVHRVVSSQQPQTRTRDSALSAERLAKAEAKLVRFQSAIEAGIDPAALVEAINQAQAERAAARADLGERDKTGAITEAEVYAMVDSLGDVGAALTGASVERLSRLYQELRLDLRYDNEKETVCATVSPRVNSVRVRGRS